MTEYRTVTRIAQGKSVALTVITLACGHRQVWESRTQLPKVGSELWCAGCYSHGDGAANLKALQRIARQTFPPDAALTPPPPRGGEAMSLPREWMDRAMQRCSTLHPSVNLKPCDECKVNTPVATFSGSRSTPETPRTELMTAEDAALYDTWSKYPTVVGNCGGDGARRILATYHALAASQQNVERLTALLDGSEQDREKLRGTIQQDAEDWATLRTENAALRASLAECERQYQAKVQEVLDWMNEIDALRASLALAQRDAERLDWLSTNEASYSLNIGGRVWVFTEHGPDCHGATLREALDAAMSPPPAPTHGETHG